MAHPPRILRATLALLGAASLVGAPGASADEPLTLDEALQEARKANARLPVAELDVAVAREHVREARAELWLKVSLDGDVVYAPSSGYDAAVSNLGETRLQLQGQQPIFDGGGRRAAVRRARAEVASTTAHHRMAVKDVDLEVRSRFAEIESSAREIGVREDGLDRLRAYRTSLESRQASGQGIAADLLKTRVRLASDEADLNEARQRGVEAKLELNDLLGRDPEAPLEIAALPDPAPEGPPAPSPWLQTPEIAAAKADAESAEAGLHVTRSERGLHLTAAADTGIWGSDTTSPGLFDRLRHDFGYSLTLNLNLPLFDLGAYRARLAASTLELEQARKTEEVEVRHARLQWAEAHASRVAAWSQIALLRTAVPDARDSSLATESRYLGGAATALDVIEAHAAALDAAVRLGDAIMRYRIAEALETRWGTE
jgi:OMF family outer membrane factor